MLGSAYDLGQGVTKDYARAFDLYTRGCNGGDMSGCVGLGGLYATGRGVARDGARASALWKQACTSGDSGGCSMLRQFGASE
jgi:uncharacterized protein